MPTLSLGFHARTVNRPFRALKMSSDPITKEGKKGKLLILGGTGFLGQTICKRATLEGYAVTSLSRRGRPPPDKASSPSSSLSFGNVDYRQGDARKKEAISDILNEGGYAGMYFFRWRKLTRKMPR